MEDRPPLLLRFQINKVFRIEKARGVGSVIRTTHLAGALGDLGEGAKHDASLVRQTDTFAGSGTGCESAAYPERTFIEMRQKLRTDDPTEYKKQSQAHR